MLKTTILSLLCVLMLVVNFGCASILSKSEYSVNITSNPDGADINVTNSKKKSVFRGKTPTTVSLKAKAGFFKGENYLVTFEKAGYETRTAKIKRTIDGWYWGNILLGGLIGMLIVDPATGAMWTLHDLHVDFNGEVSSTQDTKLQIMNYDDVPKNLRSKLIRLN